MRAQTRPRFILSSERVLGMEPESMLTQSKKSPLLEAQWRVKPVTFHHAGQGAQHTIDKAIPAHLTVCLNLQVCCLEFDRKDISMNKLVATTLESKFHVWDMRTQHPTKGFATVSEKVI